MDIFGRGSEETKSSHFISRDWFVSMQWGWVIHNQLAPGNLGSAPSEWDVPGRLSVSMTINRQLKQESTWTCWYMIIGTIHTPGIDLNMIQKIYRHKPTENLSFPFRILILLFLHTHLYRAGNCRFLIFLISFLLA